MSNTIDRENSLLASFLYIDDVGSNKDETFKIDSNIFTSSYRRAVANKINDETENDKMYGYLNITLGDQTEGTTYEHEWTDIIAKSALPLTVAKRVHSDLELAHKERIAKAFR